MQNIEMRRGGMQAACGRGNKQQGRGMERISLEPAAAALCDAAARSVFSSSPCKEREKLEEMQRIPVHKYPAQIRTMELEAGKWGKLKIFAVSPESAENCVNLIFYIHGAGWAFGSFSTHEKLVRELAVRTGSVVVFPEYALAPEFPYPTAMEQCYCALCQLDSLTAQMGFEMNLSTLTVAGDSAGGNLAIAMALLSKYRGGPPIQKLLLYYPVTNYCFQTPSYQQFHTGYYLSRERMRWFWEQYTDAKQARSLITISPLRADIKQLSGLPDTMLISAEADVVRDEGEAFARKLREAKNPVTAVRFQGTIHDFVMLNALDQTAACRAAMDVSTAWIAARNWEAMNRKSE